MKPSHIFFYTSPHICFTESHSLVHRNTSKCYMKTTHELYRPNYSEYRTSKSSRIVTCEKQCLQERDKCSTVVYINYFCSFLRQSDGALYQPIQLEHTTDAHFEAVSMLICQKGNECKAIILICMSTTSR